MRAISCLLVLLLSNFGSATLREHPHVEGLSSCHSVLAQFEPVAEEAGAVEIQEYQVSLLGLSPGEQIIDIHLLWHDEFFQNQNYDLLLTSPMDTKIFSLALFPSRGASFKKAGLISHVAPPAGEAFRQTKLAPQQNSSTNSIRPIPVGALKSLLGEDPVGSWSLKIRTKDNTKASAQVPAALFVKSCFVEGVDQNLTGSTRFTKI